MSIVTVFSGGAAERPRVAGEHPPESATLDLHDHGGLFVAGRFRPLRSGFTQPGVSDGAGIRGDRIDEVRAFLVDSMTGIEDWTFPVDHIYVEGNDVVVKYRQVLPDGRQQSGVTTLIYAGGGKFCFEEDVLNMAQVLEDLAASGWTPPDGMKFPPRQPNRDFSRP